LLCTDARGDEMPDHLRRVVSTPVYRGFAFLRDNIASRSKRLDFEETGESRFS
jgi:hypothetical protein